MIASGMDEMGKRLDISFVNMRHLDEKVELAVKKGRVLKKIKVAKIATVLAMARRGNAHMRLAAYAVAVQRVAEAVKLRGWI